MTARLEFSTINNLDDPGGGGGVALMSKSLIFKSSHHIILSPLVEIGVPYQYTITSISSPQPEAWKCIKGRSLILVNTNPKCTLKKSLQSAIQQVEHAYNPLVKAYYTYHLPCHSISHQEPWQEKIQLIPVGIRSPLAIASTLKSNGEKKILLDCSCAKSSPSWALIEGTIALPCSYGQDVSLGIDTLDSNDEEIRSLTNIYEHMKSAKYVLSLSHSEDMSYCEWEALSLGAIPVLQRNLLSDSKVSTLYEGLPIYFTDFSSISKERLEQDYGDLLIQFSNPSKYSLSKLYFPYWLHRLTKFFATGKPPQRVWENIGSIISQRKANIKDCVALDKRDPLAFSRFGRIGQTRLLKQKDYIPTSNYRRKSNLQLEFVLPRCCEDGEIEFAWVQQLLTILSNDSGIAIYYKCPHCVPLSKASDWLNSKSSPFRSDDFKGALSGVTLLDDLPLLQLGGNRITQQTCVDRIHNGKEVTAYLTHIVENYDQLAEQTVFLHSVPHSHLHFELFYRFVAFAEHCRNYSFPIDFIHLNVHYKTHPHLWTSCCGCKPWGPGSCRVGTWKYLFHDYPEMGSDYQNAHTYSSAQFAVSKRTLHHWPKSFYERMLIAINGTHDIIGCCHSSSDEPWGGHSLTGQYERMWHIIFGHTKIQRERRADYSIPSYLRLDCDGDVRCALGAL